MCNPHEPAFPGQECDAQGNPIQSYCHGLTKREWLAGMALAHPYTQTDDADMNPDKAAEWACQLADALIEELEATK